MVLSRTPTPHPLLMAKLKKAATRDEQERAQALARVYDSAKSEDDAASDSCCSSPREEATGSHASSACSEDASDDEAHSGPGTPAPAKPSVRGALGSPKPHPSAHVTWWDQAGGAAPDAATLAAMAADLAAALRRLAAAAAGTAAETGAAGGFAVGQRRLADLAGAQAVALAEAAASVAPAADTE